MVTSGLRIGTPALAARGFGDKEFSHVADVIAGALTAAPDAHVDHLAARVRTLAEQFPLYPELS
jgi:glycine hydroxymethyltransferase